MKQFKCFEEKIWSDESRIRMDLTKGSKPSLRMCGMGVGHTHFGLEAKRRETISLAWRWGTAAMYQE